MMLKSFANLFRKKQDDSAQRRAEASRKRKKDQAEIEEIQDQFNQTHHDLDVTLDEIINKKTHG